ncbi:hypothetical protein Q3C01_26830 [Bradyrhizobium sp. UFLA05-109]
MTRQTRTARARKRRSWPRESGRTAGDGEGQRMMPQALDALRNPDARNRPDGRRSTPAGQSNPAPGPMKTLSVRAQNVLKELAVELTGEQPPKGSWSPSRELLLALTAERLATARNCGPHTTREIIAWAQGCGVTIKPTIRPGGSLSEMWTRLIANAASGALSSTEIAGALQRSIRRRSVRIPIAFQIILVKILLSNFSNFE